MLTCPVIPLPQNSRWRPKTGSSFISARVVVVGGYLSQLLCFLGRQIECQYCYLDHNLSWCHISRWRRKSTTAILNLRSSTCKRSKRYVKDWFAVESNSIDLASMSFACPKTYDCNFIAVMWATFAELILLPLFICHIYFRCDGDTWRCKYYCHWKGHPWKHSSWNFVFVCLRNQITP